LPAEGAVAARPRPPGSIVGALLRAAGPWLLVVSFHQLLNQGLRAMLPVRLGLLLLLVVTLMVGCGQKSNAPAQVSGKVTYKGQPVPGGDLAFHSQNGVAHTFLKPDGTFDLAELPTGTMKVTVDTEFLNTSTHRPAYPGSQGKGGSTMDPSKMQGGAPAKVSSGEYMKIPQKYANPNTTDLTVTIQAGKNSHDFVLND
jgi:hypothetical protein